MTPIPRKIDKTVDYNDDGSRVGTQREDRSTMAGSTSFTP